MALMNSYNNDNSPSLSDRVLATDSLTGKAVNIPISNIVQLVNESAGVEAILYEFSSAYSEKGGFSTNGNLDNPTGITHLLFNKESLFGGDLSLLFNKLSDLENMVVKLINPGNANNFFNFRINNITDNTSFFDLEVEVYDGYYSGVLLAKNVYSIQFDVKENYENKVDKVTGKSLVLDTQIAKLVNLDNTKDIDKPVSTLQQKAIDTAIEAQITDSTALSDPTIPIPVELTGNVHILGVGPGTYTNWGGMVIPDNNTGTLRRVGGVYSVSLTPIILTDYTKKRTVDLILGNLRVETYYNKTGGNGSHVSLSSTPLIPITNSNTIKFLTSQAGAAYDNYVFFDNTETFISSILSSDLTLSGLEIPVNAKFIGINSATGTKQIVYVNDVVVFGIPQEQKDIKLNTTTNTANIAKTEKDIIAIKSLNSEEAVYANLLNGVNESNIFTSPNGATSTFENPGYLIESSAHNSFIYTTNEFNYTAGKRVALVANVKFEDVTDDFILKAGFFDGGFLAPTPEYTASDFGLQNLSGTTQTISLIWNATKASWILFYAYKAEMAAGNSQSFTIQNFAVLDLGLDGTNPLYNKNTAELAEMFQYSSVSGNVVNYSNVIVKTAEKALDVPKSAVTKSNKNYGKKLGTGGDSLTANLVWQPKLVEMTGLNWSSEETSEGVGFVRNDGSYLPAYKPNDDGLTYNSGDGLWYDGSSNPWRKAYKMAIGGTSMKPTNIDAISIRLKDAVFYNPDILFIYAGQNDPLDWWKTAGNAGTTPDEIVANETPWFAFTPDSGISSIAAYKGILEYIMNVSPKTIIYLITQMKVLGKVGMNPLPPYDTIYPFPRFANTEEVMNWEKAERLPRCEYIKSIGKLYGLPVIDLYNQTAVTNQNAEYWYGEPSNDCTQVHPKDIGYHRMAEVMEKHL